MNFSILMSIFSKEIPSNFQRAMQSIWDDQTYKPNEIVLVKDGPLNKELDEIINKWQTKIGDILRIVPLLQNIGLGAALNEGLQHCNNELVARMDTDDISMPERFEKQIAFMQSHNEIAVSSGFIKEIDEFGKTLSVRKLPLTHEELFNFAKTRSPISHATAIFRKSAVTAVGGYPPFRKAQDHALWSLMLTKGYKFANLNEVLYAVPTQDDFFVRRGLGHLLNEIAILKYQKKIGFIGWPQFIKNFFIRSTLRMSPQLIKKLLYKYARG